MRRAPRSSTAGSASPPSVNASDEIQGICQSVGVISSPSGRSHARSFESDSQMKSPSKKRWRCSAG